jgi:hypothetical protein
VSWGVVFLYISLRLRFFSLSLCIADILPLPFLSTTARCLVLLWTPFCTRVVYVFILTKGPLAPSSIAATSCPICSNMDEDAVSTGRILFSSQKRSDWCQHQAGHQADGNAGSDRTKSWPMNCAQVCAQGLGQGHQMQIGVDVRPTGEMCCHAASQHWTQGDNQGNFGLRTCSRNVGNQESIQEVPGSTPRHASAVSR